MMLKKKVEEKDALQKTLKDNSLNKVKMIEQLKREREEDVRCTQEYAKILEKQENDRKEYFARIERNSTAFMGGAVQNVLRNMENKNKQEEERMNNYLSEKEKT